MTIAAPAKTQTVEKTDAEIQAIRDRIQLIIPPAMFVFLLLVVGAVYFYSEFDATTANILAADKLASASSRHTSTSRSGQRSS
jgi:hypothetical protein